MTETSLLSFGGFGGETVLSFLSGECDAPAYRVGLVDFRRGRCVGATSASLTDGSGLRTVSFSFLGLGCSST